MALMKLKDIVQHEDAMAEEFCEDIFEFKYKWDKKYCVEIAL